MRQAFLRQMELELSFLVLDEYEWIHFINIELKTGTG